MARMSAMLVAVCWTLTITGAACGPTPLPGSRVETRLVAGAGPRIPNGAIFAASDLTTLRAMIDAADGAAAGQLGGAVTSHQCRVPYTDGVDRCWPRVPSRPGEAYAALDISGGFCQQAEAPEVYVAGTHVVVRVGFSGIFNCHLSGVMALPSASLIAFRTDGLERGLYDVSYLLQFDSDSYRSNTTYLSVPGPAASSPIQMEDEAARSLVSVVGTRSGIFSVARIDGAQLGRLCQQTVAGPAYLITYLQSQPRAMLVVLAGPVPHTCSTTPV